MALAERAVVPDRVAARSHAWPRPGLPVSRRASTSRRYWRPRSRAYLRFFRANDETLWAQALSLYPNSAHICRQWANGVNLVRGPAPALVATDHCIERFGPSLFVKNRGILLAQTGQSLEAQRWLRRAQLANPEDRSLQRYLDALGAIGAARATPPADRGASEGL
jgi:hypothetical protein